MSTMNYLSICSGIEAATVAWHPLGWQPLAFSEIEPFPSAVLAHHWPDVPNLGDMTTYGNWPSFRPQLIVGGTPCQAFSVAGLRKGLADPRGNLTLTFLAILARYRPTWVVWENVPGVLSDRTGAFGSFLGGLAKLGYGWAYRVLDAQHFGVPQRRRRVFVVGNLGDWRRAAAVLFERHCMQGHPPPSREAREGITCSPAGIAATVSSKWSKGSGGPAGDEHYNLIAHTLRAEGHDASEDGTGRGVPLVPVAFDTTQITSAANFSNPKPGDPCHPLAAGAHPPAIAFNLRGREGGAMPEVDPDGLARTRAASGGSSRSYVATALQSSQSGVRTGDVHATLDSNNGSRRHNGVIAGASVRRLTPRECERLQGFPDDHTLIPWRKKPAADCPDGPRYKALGNSMAVPVMRWIGERIKLVETLSPTTTTP